MLWSLAKIVLFVALMIALTLGAIALMDMNGGMRIAIGSTEFNLGPLQSVIALILLVLFVWVAIKALGLLVATFRFLNGDETAISRWFDRRREEKGYRALSESMLAIASGDARDAIGQAGKAERLLGRPDLTNLLTAQAAEMSGDKKRAETAYRALLKNDHTRFVGVRGIMKQRLEEGDTETALKLAEKAFSLKPRHVETQDVLLRLQAENEDWEGARKTLDAKVRAGALPRDVHRRRDAVLALSQAATTAQENPHRAEEESIEANRLSPDLVPAAVMAARSHIAQDKQRYATRVIKKAWDAAPHPDLAAVFAEIVPDETPQERLKRFKSLTRVHPDASETKMLLAELHIAAEDFPSARKAIGDLVEIEPTARSLTIMAAIERGEGAEDSIVRGWLTKALTSSRGPQWICQNCQSIHQTWEPTCSNCSGFDTMAWKTPAEGEVAMPRSTEMLPLIVGKPEIEDVVEIMPAEEIDSEDTDTPQSQPEKQ